MSFITRIVQNGMEMVLVMRRCWPVFTVLSRPDQDTLATVVLPLRRRIANDLMRSEKIEYGQYVSMTV